MQIAKSAEFRENPDYAKSACTISLKLGWWTLQYVGSPQPERRARANTLGQTCTLPRRGAFEGSRASDADARCSERGAECVIAA